MYYACRRRRLSFVVTRVGAPLFSRRPALSHHAITASATVTSSALPPLLIRVCGGNARVTPLLLCSQGGIGHWYNWRLNPSFTLGAGSWGNNSTTANVGPADLLNYKRVVRPCSKRALALLLAWLLPAPAPVSQSILLCGIFR